MLKDAVLEASGCGDVRMQYSGMKLLWQIEPKNPLWYS